ncbi:B3 domain-containing protein Os01g0234100-like isoform X2 [Rosa rugosa]|uniref:B3 domain-containing protein Os01g0234100-like isoform X2 n=1 Tax=Rosa rugosa TaxID=74645 RepID=UPI002B410529|nr:B3 domain-containing protein Os01g0234100-like isoform X2 [Rosa rugosa]
MAIVQEQKQSSKVLQIKRGRSPNKEEKLLKRKSSCLEQTTKNINMVNAKSIKSESSLKPKRLKRATEESVYDTSQAQLSVLERAKEIEASLAPGFPTLIKVMLPSHVTGGFWLGLPKKFCCVHLPKHDTMIALEDESGEEYQTKYLADKVGLSGGWRGFSIAHKLVEGDVVVFHRVTPSKFKVYIVRSKGSDESDCSLGLMNLGVCIKEMDTGDITTCEGAEYEDIRPISVENPQNYNTIACNTKSSPIADLSENDTGGLGSEVFDGIGLAESVIPFKEVSSLENFNIIVDGFIINSEFPKPVLAKYYDLCCSQNAYLHERLLDGLNWQLITGAISEITTIAEGIRTCKASTLECNFPTWNKTLQAFEVFGMNVGFLRTRLDKLASLASESKRGKEARHEREQAEVEMRTLEAKLLEVKRTISRLLEVETETQNVSSEKLEDMLQQVAKAPW